MRFLSFLCLLLFTYLICGAQTTLWTQFFSWVPAPLLWLNLVVYLTIERPTYTALTQIYCVGLIVLTFTAMPIGLLLMTLFLLFWIIHFVRVRIYWHGSMYFAFMCFIGLVAYQVIFLISSQLIETNATGLLFFERIVQILITPLFSFWMYMVLKKFDFWFRVSGPELEGIET